MRRPLVLAGLALVLFPRPSLGQAAERFPPMPGAWLAGCWEMAGDELVIEEHWMSPRGGTMLAMSRTSRGGQMIANEWIVLRQTAEGLVYEADPSGQAPASFPSTRITDTSLVFVNPEHDFPQMISYFLIGGDSLHARIEGDRGRQRRRVDFGYRRVACPGR